MQPDYDLLYEESIGEYFYHQGWTAFLAGVFDWRRARRDPDYLRGARDGRQRLRQHGGEVKNGA